MAQSGVAVLGPPAIALMQARVNDSINAVRSEQTSCRRTSIQKIDHTLIAKINSYPRRHGQAISCRRPCLGKGDGTQRIQRRLGRQHPISFGEQDNLTRQAGRSFVAGRKELGQRIEAIQSQEGARRPDQTFTLTKEHIDQARLATRPYLESVLKSPERRPDCTPYLLLHPVGTQVRGTVLLFHGFAGTPKQMSVLARYLFHAGYNVYNPSLEGQCFADTDQYWPRVDLRAEFYNPVAAAAASDPPLQKFFAALGAVGAGEDEPPPETPNLLEMGAVVAALLRLQPDLADIVKCIVQDDHPEFDTYFESDHMKYLEHAEKRLKEVEALPGPVVTAGLSVGGTVALALAASHPDRVSAVVAFAPLLKVHGAVRAQYVNLVGPLHLRETGYDPSLKFSVGCYTANQRFGRTVVSSRSVDALSRVPTLMVLTENEDAADVAENEQLSERLARAGTAPHLVLKYGEEYKVPHPMVDPLEESQGMSNAYWKTMYQETLRFLIDGKIDVENFRSAQPSDDLPQPLEPEAAATDGLEIPPADKEGGTQPVFLTVALVLLVIGLGVLNKERALALLGQVLRR